MKVAEYIYMTRGTDGYTYDSIEELVEYAGPSDIETIYRYRLDAEGVVRQEFIPKKPLTKAKAK